MNSRKRYSQRRYAKTRKKRRKTRRRAVSKRRVRRTARRTRTRRRRRRTLVGGVSWLRKAGSAINSAAKTTVKAPTEAARGVAGYVKDAKRRRDVVGWFGYNNAEEAIRKLFKGGKFIRGIDSITYSHAEPSDMILCAMEQTIDHYGTGISAEKALFLELMRSFNKTTM